MAACGRCSGSGKLWDLIKNVWVSKNCPACGGSGQK